MDHKRIPLVFRLFLKPFSIHPSIFKFEIWFRKSQTPDLKEIGQWLDKILRSKDCLIILNNSSTQQKKKKSINSWKAFMIASPIPSIKCLIIVENQWVLSPQLCQIIPSYTLLFLLSITNLVVLKSPETAQAHLVETSYHVSPLCSLECEPQIGSSWNSCWPKWIYR